MILQELVPEFHFSERHHVMTQVRPDHLYRSIVTLDLSSSPLVKCLYAMRRMPRTSLTLAGMQSIGFTVLGSDPGREFVIGLIGRFWKLLPQIAAVAPERFAAFDEPGYAKAALNYLIDDTGAGVRLSTETRIFCTSAGARTAFALYWALIRPFSGLIRRAMLRSIVQGAQAYATQP